MKVHGFRWAAAIFAVLTLGAGVPAASAATLAPADVNDFSFESFSADYYLDQDAAGHATLRVVETIVALFPDFDQNRGIIRALPLTYGEYLLEPSMVSISDGEGNPVYYERADYDGFAEYALGTDDFVQGRTVYVLEYTMKNPIMNFSDEGVDEFYWDVNGNGWGQSFDTVSARVFLSDQLAAALTGDAACYSGYYGESDACEISRSSSGTQFDASVGPLGPYETLTLSIGFEGGTVTQPQLPRDSWIVQLAPKILLGIQGVIVAIAIAIRSFVWRNARGRGTIIAQYTPPGDSDLLLDANLVGRQSSGMPALLVDFAVRGIISIIDTDPGESKNTDRYRFQVEFISNGDASPREIGVLRALFGKGADAGKRANLGSLPASAGATLYSMTTSTANYAVDHGFRAERKSVASKYLGRAAFWTLAGFVPIWIWAAFADVLEGNVVLPALAAGALWIAVPIILIKPKLLTTKGAEAKEYLLGIREYLTIAEADRLRVLQSPEGALRVDVTDTDAVVKLNERLLPYAVLWGVEDRWVEVLRTQYAETNPAWLEGTSFSSSMLRSFSTASTSSVRPIVTTSSSSGSSWSSSSSSSFSSGSSGGGFSGGGGGGGGGGGR